jgi:hypothetical protein
MKRVVAMGDTHCGHLVGLTHPSLDVQHNSEEYAEIDRARRAYWEWYADEIAKLHPIDALIFNGDAVDGKGTKSGGTELIAADRTKQVEMAVAAVEETKAKAKYFSYGTGYHVGVDDDWENEVAEAVGAKKIGSHDWLNVNGQVFDYKHFINSSIIPHGRHTAMSREKLWNIIWSEGDLYPNSTIILRSHVHYFTVTGDDHYMGFTLPALQGLGSKFGARVCSGVVKFGFMHFDIEENGDYTWHAHILKPKPHRALVL